MPSVPRMSIISMMVRGALEYTLRGPHCQCSPSRVGWFQRQAYPLMYRTWIYHDTIVKVSKIGQSHDENGVLRHVLSQRCIDAPINGGRSSPLMCLACGGGGMSCRDCRHSSQPPSGQTSLTMHCDAGRRL